MDGLTKLTSLRTVSAFLLLVRAEFKSCAVFSGCSEIDKQSIDKPQYREIRGDRKLLHNKSQHCIKQSVI